MEARNSQSIRGVPPAGRAAGSLRRRTALIFAVFFRMTRPPWTDSAGGWGDNRTEPPDLWTARAPASMKDRVPVQRTSAGRTAWILDGTLWANTGGNVIKRGHEKVLGTLYIQPFDEID